MPSDSTGPERTDLREAFFAETRRDPYANMVAHLAADCWALGYEQALRVVALRSDAKLRPSETGPTRGGSMEDEHRHDHQTLEHIEHQLREANEQLRRIHRRLDEMTIDQQTFDTDLAALVAAEAANGAAITNLTAAIDAWIAAHPGVDLTAEDQAVQSAAAEASTAAQALADELAKLNPTPTPPGP